MKKFKIALLLVGIPLLAVGGEGLYHAATNRQQITVTCAQFAQQPPSALWVRVTGCEIDYVGASYRDARGRIGEFYFPVRPAGQPSTVPATLVAATRDPEVLALAQITIGDDRQPDQETFLIMMLQIVTLLKASREVEGYIRAGVLQRLQTRQAVADVTTPLAPEFAVLDLHAQPRFIVPGLEVVAGAGAILWWIRLGGRRRAAPELAPPEQAIASAPAPAIDELAAPESLAAGAAPVPQARPQPPAPLAAMLLLNLDDRAGVDAIEHAPPLGNLTEVTRRLEDACPGIIFDEAGRGVFAGEDFSLVLDVGRLEPVWTATIYPHGVAVAEAVRAIASRTGWRVFVPKQGTFLAPTDHEEAAEK